LREDAVLGAELLDVSLLEVGVALDLVDRRRDRGAIEQGCEVVDHEVADADRADLAAGDQCLEGAVGLQGAVERRGQRLVEDQEVDLVDAELAGALLEAVQCLVVSVVADPDLGLQEDLGPVQVGALDCLSDLALVAVGRGGVDVTVAPASAERTATASRVSSGGVWKTPRPSAGTRWSVVTPAQRNPAGRGPSHGLAETRSARRAGRCRRCSRMCASLR
jgi:hypothetical protein